MLVPLLYALLARLAGHSPVPVPCPVKACRRSLPKDRQRQQHD
ncbi:hypothetical protein [Solidesulfovibrio sp.]